MHQYPWLRLVGLAGFLLVLMLFLTLARPPFRVYSDTDLTGLVNAAYGARVQDAVLHDLAHERAQFQVAYSGGACALDSLSHVGSTTAEVLACNYTGPERAVEQWLGSPAHNAILSDQTFTSIGCASAAGTEGAWFFACVLDTTPVRVSGGPQEPTPAPSSGGSASGPALFPTPEPVLLPNTRMTWPSR